MANELILVIEDNEQNRKLVRDILQVKGYRVIETDNAETGIALAAERQPELLLIDVHLPGMSGIEAVAKLRAMPRMREVPMFAFTASVMPEDRRTIMEAGFDGFIAKPINVKEFLATVAGVLERRGDAKGTTKG